eukprot:TRINITY_DN6503_c0_g1_i1.p1 TRINITY_DN6503_c0_g1~~TRINITY_DN6503_c0_g1_i1.p1  ORF type:complete len:294 (-),score=57.60 TRINITY_DN6503_c0_g1_i1:877-1758(-)
MRLANVESLFRGIAFMYVFFLTSIAALLEYFTRPFYYPVLGKKLSVGPLTPWDRIVRWFFKVFFELYGIDVHTTFHTKPRDDKNCLVMFAHGSNLDPPSIMLTFPQMTRFVAKDDLFKIPLFGKVMRNYGHVPIARSNLKSAIESLQRAGELVNHEKLSVAISPEGTRRRSNSLGSAEQFAEFKKGPFHLAKSAKVDIVPAVLMGANRLWPPGQLFPNQGQLFLRYCEPIPAEFIAKSSIEEVQELVQKRFAAEIRKVEDKVIFDSSKRRFTLLFVVWGLMVSVPLILKLLLF